MLRPKLVVFDLDDTLILERDYAFSGFEAISHLAAGWYPNSDFGKACKEKWASGHTDKVFNTVFEDSGITPSSDIITAMISSYREHVPTIELLPDAYQCLNRLLSLEISPTLSVISDGPLASQSNKIKALQLPINEELIFLTDAWGREFWKPHPRAFLTAQRFVNAESNSCVYIGDNPKKDFSAPSKLGWNCIRINRPEGIHHNEIADSNEVSATISNLVELFEVFQF